MSGLYAYINDEYIQRIANTKGWCDLGDWAFDREDQYPILATLYEEGLATEFKLLKKELASAKSSCRDKEIREVISALQQAIGRVKGTPEILAILDEDAAAEDDPPEDQE